VDAEARKLTEEENRKADLRNNERKRKLKEETAVDDQERRALIQKSQEKSKKDVGKR
jgi:hypothetical protein